MGFPIGIQLYSVRDQFEADPKQTLRQIKEMGYDGVEFAGVCAFDVEEMRMFLAEIGLVALAAHVPVHQMREDAKGIFGAYQQLGCNYVVLPHIGEEYYPENGRFGEIIAWAEELGAIAKQMGLTLLYHNHDFEFQKMGDEFGLDVLYRTVDPSLLQTEIDTCWVKVAGVDPVEHLLQYAGRSPIVHFKDFYKDNQNPGKDESFELRPVGYGVQDFKAILQASAQIGAQWIVVEQDEPSMGKTSMECAKMSIEYLRTIL